MRITLSRLYVAVIGIALSALVVSTSRAADFIPYTEKAFEKAKTQNKIVLLQFHASWCPTCRSQKSALERALKEPAFTRITPLSVDYDEETKLKKELRVSAQSTLILFKGNSELTRSISLTDPDDLRAFLKKVNP